WVSDADPQSLEAVTQSPEQAPPSPDYVLGLEHPPSPDYIPGPEYLEYVALADDEILVEDQPLPADASPTALSPGYEEEESSKDDDDHEEEEAFEEDKDEEEEHLALSDSAVQKNVRFQPHIATFTEVLIVEFASAPTPPSPPPSPLSPWLQSSRDSVESYITTTCTITTLLLPSANRRSDIPETDMPFRKRLCLTALDSRFEIWESSTATAARQTRHTLACRVDYGFINTVDASIRASKSRAMTVVEVNERVTDLATT
ncbi:hypothetical protein Tco_0157580, partial [Tanacetum coccineum]